MSLDQKQRFFNQSHNVEIRERIRLLAGIVQELGNNWIQALRFPADDLDELLVVVFQRRETRQLLEGAGHGREGLPNLMGYGCRKPAESRHALLVEHFAFKALHFRQVLKVEYEAPG